MPKSGCKHEFNILIEENGNETKLAKCCKLLGQNELYTGYIILLSTYVYVSKFYKNSK